MRDLKRRAAGELAKITPVFTVRSEQKSPLADVQLRDHSPQSLACPYCVFGSVARWKSSFHFHPIREESKMVF